MLIPPFWILAFVWVVVNIQLDVLGLIVISIPLLSCVRARVPIPHQNRIIEIDEVPCEWFTIWWKKHDRVRSNIFVQPSACMEEHHSSHQVSGQIKTHTEW